MQLLLLEVYFKYFNLKYKKRCFGQFSAEMKKNLIFSIQKETFYQLEDASFFIFDHFGILYLKPPN